MQLPLRRSLVLAAGLILCASRGDALDPSRAVTQYLRDTWQTEQGLPQNSVSAIQRTRDGYLWVGTEDGLARFDGVRFTVFNRRNTPGLASASINTLMEDSRGRLWIGTARGLSVLENGRFRKVAADLRIATLLESGGTIWVGTLGDGLYRIASGATALERTGVAIAGKRVRAIVADARGTLWLATEAGLVAIEGGVARTLTTKDGLADDNVFALWPVSDGTLWVGSDGGVQSLRGPAFTTVPAPNGALTGVRAMWRDHSGSLWVGTQSAGLARIRDGRVESLTTGRSLASDTVTALAEDAESNLWVGTSGGGLVRLRDGKVVTLSTDEGLPAATVFTIFEDREKATWIGTRGGGVTRFTNGSATTWSTKDGLPTDDVVSVAQGADGAMWIGTYGGGIGILRNGRIANRIDRKSGLASDAIYALLATRDGSMWIGTGGAGLDRLRDGKVTHFGEREGLPGTFVEALLEDERGGLWVGTNDGLARIENDRVTAWTTREGLPDKAAIALAKDGATLWIGTPGTGLVRFRDGHFDAVDMTRGLHDDMIASIIDDGQGRFWCSTNHGIFSVSKKELGEVADGRRDRVSCDVYGASDGMKSAEAYGGSYPVAMRASDGRLWFATIRGAAIVDPQHLARNTFPPPVVLESVTADGREVPADGRLGATTKRVEFRWSGLSLRDPARVTFRYMLEGFDPQWIDGGTARTVSYTNLRHGHYRFVLKARNEDGVWSQAAVTRSFQVVPPVWDTWWFRVLAGIALIAIAFGAHRLRVWRLHARQRQLELVVEARTRELNAANRELERLARVDGLTGIANRRAFDEALQKAWADERRRDGSLAVILCDIDQFKKFNDSQGHQAGDETLRAVAQALAGAVRRETDLAARYGGEEMVILLPDTDAAHAARVAENVLESVRGLKLPHPASDVAPFVTLSLGIAAARPADGGAAADLVLRADAALYRAKTEGRNRCVAA